VGVNAIERSEIAYHKYAGVELPRLFDSEQSRESLFLFLFTSGFVSWVWASYSRFEHLLQ